MNKPPYISRPFSETLSLFRQSNPDVQHVMAADGEQLYLNALTASGSAVNAAFPGVYGFDSAGIHKLADNGSGEAKTPRMFQAIRPGGEPPIFLFHTFSPRSRSYWENQARALAGKVDLIDPSRCKLRDLRAAGFSGWRVYRGAKPGIHGKSAEIKTV